MWIYILPSLFCYAVYIIADPESDATTEDEYDVTDLAIVTYFIPLLNIVIMSLIVYGMVTANYDSDGGDE